MSESCFGQRRMSPGPARRAGRRIVAVAGVIVMLLGLPPPAAAEGETAPSSFSARFAAAEEPAADTTPAPAAESAKPAEPANDAAKGSGKTADTPPPKIQVRPQANGPIAGPDARSRYRAAIEKEAAGTGLAPEIAEAVMGVESGYNPDVIGGVGEIGLMQILPSTARMLGFSGTLAELAVPEANIHYGVMYLARAWRLAGGDLCTATMKYRAGHGETRFSYLSVNYCVAVRAKLFARGFQVTGTVPVASFGEPARGGGGGGGGCGRKCLGGARIGRVDLAALNTRLNALVVQVRAGR
ncbi:lytic transglycosylase domain-containing protein [Bradyrhizobium tropiciagri]|uniref:lytic transglycosylase domain-containing protein n=1 Tax=Bradyrhizobium tropiciagri TaxID=312253 RepID=UPI002012C669|nr:lytic transglycosylase domain-containing protein [Bradyrhizobium tropiciagri]